ncbi:MAG: DUF5666 domain-containing protein [Acidobacteriaceae bacterium]
MKRSKTGSWTGCALLVLALAEAGSIGCGSGTTTPTQPQSGSTPVLVNMGDSPSDSVLECAVTISRMSLTNTSGTSVSVLPAWNSPVNVSEPATLELAHLRGTVAPLMMPSLPQGTYNAVSITVSSVTVNYMTASSHGPQQMVFNPSVTVNIPLSTPLTVGSNAMVLNLELNLASSVGMSGGAITFTPVFNTSVDTASGNANATPEQGGVMGMVGIVAGTSGSSFAMGLGNITTGSGTTFSGMNGQSMTGMGMMSSGQIVEVNATLQPNGTWNASSVTDMMASGGVLSMGIITATTGTPATQATIFLDYGTGVLGAFMADGITVNLNSSTTYAIDDAGVSLSGAPFPVTFDASHMAVGQNCSMSGSGSIQPPPYTHIPSSYMDEGGMTASGVVLEPQGLGGAVGNASSSGFTLNLASDSAFTLLTGATGVTVYQTSETQLNGLTSIASGQNVEVYGYLFYNAGSYNFVATQIAETQTGAA